MDAPNYDVLKLDHQLCFPLYACAKEVVRRYKPFLDELDLTYTQYIAMMLLWERGNMTSKELGKALFLDSGTLTPMLKKMEAKGLITRRRDAADERNLALGLTEKGFALRERAVQVPDLIAQCMELEPEEAVTLYTILYKLLGQFSGE